MTYRQVESERAGRDLDGPIIPPYASYQRFVQGLRQGHDTAWTGLDNHYHKLALSRAARIVGFNNAGDVVNIAFFRLYEKFTSGNPPDDRVEEEAGLKRLLLNIVYHAAVDTYRQERKRRFREIPLEDYINSGEQEERGGNPEDILEQAETGRMVRETLGGIPPAQREVLAARYFRGLTQVETADTLKMSLGTVKTREWLGKKHMRAFLASQGYQP